MQIAVINFADQGGGAEKAAVKCMENYRQNGKDARLFVAKKLSKHPHIFELPLAKFPSTVLHQYKIGNGENSCYSVSLEKHFQTIDFNPVIIHFHNLHGGYFNIKELPKLSQKYKLIWTAHDSWPITGHCAFQMECNEWKVGCTACPDYNRYPAIKKGKTSKEFSIKRRSIMSANIQWQLVSSHQESDYRKAYPFHQITIVPNKINYSIFKKGDKNQAKQELGISLNMKLVLLNGKYFQNNVYRDFDLVLRLLNFYKKRKDILFVFIGTINVKALADFENTLQLGFISKPETIALWYQASDVFFHPAKAESQGLSVMEAIACGLPVFINDLPAYEYVKIEEAIKIDTTVFDKLSLYLSKDNL